MAVRRIKFGKTKEGIQSHLYTLTNNNGMCLQVTDYGAAMVSLLVPDREGTVADVILGFDDVSGYEKTTHYMGATIGRHAGQISNGAFTLNGKTFSLVVNDHDHTMHGGPDGFHKQIFDAVEQKENKLQLSYLSRDGEAGFPGNLTVTVTYRLSEDNELFVDFDGCCDEDTILNMTNHSYFNMNGQNAPTVLDNQLKIYADRYTEVDDQGLPTGVISSVEDTPLDFREFVSIATLIDVPVQQLQYCGGFDHNWVISSANDDKMRICCELKDSKGRRHMQIFSNLPGLQMYSGNYLDGSEKGKRNQPYAYRSAICLEPQLFPNGLSNSHFPTPILRQGEQYRYRSMYKFIYMNGSK